MEKFIEKEGDLIKLSKQNMFDAIVHGCNCKKNWGKGLALSMKNAYPKAYLTDLNSIPKLGEISINEDYACCDIINAYTQLYPGSKGWGQDSEFNRYEAIKSCMIEINKNYNGKIIGLPLIGCGLAGLKWSKVKKIIKNELIDCYVVIIRYEIIFLYINEK